MSKDRNLSLWVMSTIAYAMAIAHLCSAHGTTHQNRDMGFFCCTMARHKQNRDMRHQDSNKAMQDSPSGHNTGTKTDHLIEYLITL